MKEIKITTKKGTELWNNYRMATKTLLAECYGKVSQKKAMAYYDCIMECASKGGFSPRICSWNSFRFTFAYQYIENDVAYLVYKTGKNDYLVKLD